MWGIFGKHHYLSAKFNKAAELYLVYWGDVLVAMFSTLAQPNGYYKNAFRVHRAVVLPDYQGLGIGTKMMDFFGELYIRKGCKLFLKSTHVRLAMHCRNNPAWLETSCSGKAITRVTGNEGNKYKNHYIDREAYSFEYVGVDYTTKPHKTIVADDGYIITKSELARLKEQYYLIVATGKPKEENQCERWCKELGVRTEQLYYNKNGTLLKNGKFEGCKCI